jgi:hypothetical protein
MKWVKSKVDYYRHIGIATGTDAMEVMFKRGDALAAEIGQGGFIPDAMLSTLTRKPGQAKKTADALVKTGLWERTRGGYQIVDFADINDEMVRLTERKQRDRDRKRAERAAAREAEDTSGSSSTDVSTDSPKDGPAPRPQDSLSRVRTRTRTETAAAAAAPAAAAGDVSIEILADKLRQHTALRALRTDKLSDEQAAVLVALIAKHGDQRLVDQALAAMRRDDPPRTIQAFLPGWQVMPAPGQRLAVVQAPPCPQPGHSGTTLHCAQCASEQKAAR